MYDGYLGIRNAFKNEPGALQIFSTITPANEEIVNEPGALEILPPPLPPNTEIVYIPTPKTPIRIKIMKIANSNRIQSKLTLRSTIRRILNTEMLNFTQHSISLKRLDFIGFQTLENDIYQEMVDYAPTALSALVGLSSKLCIGESVQKHAMVTVVSTLMNMFKNRPTLYQKLIGISLWRTKASLQVRCLVSEITVKLSENLIQLSHNLLPYTIFIYSS